MRTEDIVEIGILEGGGLYVRPAETSFDQIYRAAMQIDWDDRLGRLVSPKPEKPPYANWHEWTYADWLRQIVAAAKGEYGVRLVSTRRTRWNNLSQPLISELKKVLASAA